MEDITKKIQRIEAEIASLPTGYISRKNIRGQIKQYYQWTEDGKKKSKYLDDDTAAKYSVKIDKRRELQSELKHIKEEQKTILKKTKSNKNITPIHTYSTEVLTGDSLRKLLSVAEGFKKRECYSSLEKYIYSENTEKVFILFGLRRTGKTTLIRQVISSMNLDDFNKTAFIQITSKDNLGDVNKDLRWLIDNDYKYVFIDEVTLAEDFIEGAALFSDIYAASGLKIVLSGTDSLGFIFSESEELYDRCILLHTTWISYREFELVLGIRGIDDYIRYGGTMSLGGIHYNETGTFATKENTDEYIDSAIAKNIQHSLRYYQYGGHFRHLAKLYEKNELTSAINRVVEDINHRFTLSVLTDDFISHDLGLSAKNLRKDRNSPIDILDHIDKESFVLGLRKSLDILNKPEQSVSISDIHRHEIKEYLDLLDLTVDIPTEHLPVKNDRLYQTVVAQPGLRYSQAKEMIKQLLLDEAFQRISITERSTIFERILGEIRGRMMEEIVLLETKMAYPKKNVFKLLFPVGEFDMVVSDPVTLTCEIYEIKHSDRAVPEQYKNLIDKEKVDQTEFRYGEIIQKTVIYRGDDMKEGKIIYKNVENYLKELPSVVS